MNSIQKKFLAVLFLSIMFISCSDDDGPKQPVVTYDNVAYVVNYGSYAKGDGEISTYNIDNETISQDGYKNINGVALASNIQSMAVYNDAAYLMSNAGDKIDILNAATLKANGNPVSNDIIKPRYFAATGNTAYISCWGEVNDWSVMANGYIAKMNLETNAITKINVPNGPEGLIISNGKLFVGLTTMNKVAVIDLATNAISYINMSAIPQQFVADDAGNIWVSLVSKFTVPFPPEKLGLAVINPKNNTVLDDVNFPGIGGDGIIAISPDKKTIYAMGAEAWPGTATTIYAIDVASKTVGSSALITGEKFNGFNVNPENNDIYVAVAPDFSNPGKLSIYASNGTLLSEKEAGIAPKHVLFYTIKTEEPVK